MRQKTYPRTHSRSSETLPSLCWYKVFVADYYTQNFFCLGSVFFLLLVFAVFSSRPVSPVFFSVAPPIALCAYAITYWRVSRLERAFASGFREQGRVEKVKRALQGRVYIDFVFTVGAKGYSVRFLSVRGRSTKGLAVGDEIAVRYDPHDPRVAYPEVLFV